MRVRKLHRLEVPAGLTFKALKHSCLQELNNNSIKIMICPTEQPNNYFQKRRLSSKGLNDRKFGRNTETICQLPHVTDEETEAIITDGLAKFTA